MSLHVIELQWIEYIQNTLRSRYTDAFFIGWHYFDTFTFMILIIATTWFFLGKRQGMYLFYIFLVSSIVNTLCKNYFCLSRPCQINSAVGIIHFSSPGFPSGAAQTAAILAGFVIINSKKIIHIFFAILFAFLLCFSRIYLGLHYFSDIMGGLFIGSLLIAIYGRTFPISTQNEKKILLITLLFPMVYLPFFQSKFLIQMGLSAGIALGVLISEIKIKDTYEKKNYFLFLEVLCAVIGILLLFEIKSFFPHAKLYFAFAGGFWFSFMGPFLVRHVTHCLRDSSVRCDHT